MAESQEAMKIRMKEVIRRLRQEYPDAVCTLAYKSPHQLLVSTILSAQCTDKRVNTITSGLFRKYPDVQAFAYADEEELADDIRSCGYHNQKARAIKGASLAIWEEHGGEVPRTMEELVCLPGVGRKTANCILGTAYGIPCMVIDTHMVRIMGLLGFTRSKNPEKIEREIMALTPKKDWIDLTHLVIEHGRRVCIAHRPKCSRCVLSIVSLRWKPSFGNGLCPSSTVPCLR